MEKKTNIQPRSKQNKKFTVWKTSKIDSSSASLTKNKKRKRNKLPYKGKEDMTTHSIDIKRIIRCYYGQFSANTFFKNWRNIQILRKIQLNKADTRKHKILNSSKSSREIGIGIGIQHLHTEKLPMLETYTANTANHVQKKEYQ